MRGNNKLSEFGSGLRAKRKELNISREEVASKLKIRESYIKAIEKGEVNKTPSHAYFLGYVKSYSEFLGEQSFEEFKQHFIPVNENHKLKPQEIVSPHYLLPSNITLAVSMLLCIMMVIVSYLIL